MTAVERLAEFAVRASYEVISDTAREQLKIHILDALGCAIGASGGEPVRLVREYVREFDRGGPCTLIGGETAAPDHATFYNGALVRYLDYNDSYLAKGETCHPSDNLSAVLAAAEYANGTGRDLLASLAVAYQVQCRLCDEAPVRDKGFDHTTQGAYAVSAGVSRALQLDTSAAANAIAISGTAFNALRVTRTGRLSHWKGLAYPNMAASCVRAAFLARRGLTGPREVLEGNKGFMQAIAGSFTIDWRDEDLERVTRTIIKRHNAEMHSQTAIDAVLQLKRQHHLSASDVQRVTIEIFDVAFKIIGGGEEGDKRVVHTKEQADHSLPYLIAVALLDDRVSPEQFTPERILRQDVQDLLRRISVHANEAYSTRFPDTMPCRVTVVLTDGRQYAREVESYAGLGAPALSSELVREKFEELSEPYTTASLRDAIADAIRHLDSIRASDLTKLLGHVDAATPRIAAVDLPSPTPPSRRYGR
jgi:2-methylcitrate dehydratase